MRKVFITIAGFSVVGAVALVFLLQPIPTTAETKPGYVGTDVCAGCHKAIYTDWLLTPHRRTLAADRTPDKTGCEGCHGPGGEHVAGGGDTTKITKFYGLQPKAVSDICLKCHKQQDVMLYRTGLHAASKVTCIDCHDPHSTGRAKMLRDINSKQYSIRGLAARIKEAKMRLDVASSERDKTKALAEVDKLEKKKAALMATMDSPESRDRRATQSELCFSCHKEQQTQFHQPAHHPIVEGKMECSGCHNPHGGARGNLKEESINQTCFKCHAEMEGPYVFEHPPVEEDCTICHRPHGSPQNYLLQQSQPFLCLKCHPGPHSRSSTFSNGDTPSTTSRIPNYYWQCTSCHTRPHGSDRHSAFHY